MNGEILKYIDLFGTKFSFYTEFKPKLYTQLGGILSALSIIICIIVFFLMNVNDFKRNYPITLTSSMKSDTFHKIKFGEEKIWIPWRIVDYNDNYFNHSGIFYPIINYYYRENKNDPEKNIIKSEKLNYKLCSETSMINKSDIYNINLPLNELYCIDMDNIYMGGSWINSFLYYIEFNIFLCEDDNDNNKINSYCTKYEDLQKYNTNFNIEIFYPTFHFQANNLSTPVIIMYKEYFYQLSKFSNKVDRLYLKKYILNDEKGWFGSNNKNSTYWGFSSLNSDFYLNDFDNELLNRKENSTLKLYSLNIYLEPGFFYYQRAYKNIFYMIQNSLPIIYLIFLIFKMISKLFKVASINKKITELLFENLTITTKKKDIKMYKISKNKNKSMKLNNRVICRKTETQPKENNPNNLNIFTTSSFMVLGKSNYESRKDFVPSILSKNFTKDLEKNPNNENIIDTSYNINKKRMSRNFKSMNMSHSHRKKIDSDNFVNKYNNVKPTNIIIQSQRYKKNKLFPLRFYFYWVFIKSIDLSKNSMCFSKKFVKVHTFICQLFDISSYLVLQKQFNIIKHAVTDANKLNLVEFNKKINVNDKRFIKNINECILDQKKFSIFRKNIGNKNDEDPDNKE